MSHKRCTHECSVHTAAQGSLEAVQLNRGGIVHASLQGSPATLCGYYIQAFDATFAGWWDNHNPDKRCGKCDDKRKVL